MIIERKNIFTNVTGGDFVVPVTGGILLLFAAGFCSLRLNDDSFAHFAGSVKHIADFSLHAFILDTWNRPVPVLLYGFSGCAGIYAARAVSIAVVLLMAWFVHRCAEIICRTEFPPSAAIGLVLFQSAVLTHAHLTMTEQIAAVFLAGGLYLLLINKTFLAAVAWSLMPLSRAETTLILAWLSLCVFAMLVKRNGFKSALLKIIPWGLLAWLPFLIWWTAGYALTGSIGWMTPEYVYLRPMTFDSFWLINGFSGLPSGVQPSLLFTALAGVFYLSTKVNRSAEVAATNAPVRTMIAGGMLIHLLFVSLVVVYPRDSGWSAIGVAAINYRNYANIAPLLGLLSYFGVYAFLNVPSDHKRILARTALAGVVLFLTGFLFFHWRIKSVFDPVITLWCIVHASLAFMMYLWVTRPHSQRQSFWRGVCVLAVVSGIMAYPFFWYPLRFQDRTEQMLRALGGWLDAHESSSPVIQDISGSGAAEWLWNTGSGKTVWLYPAQLEKAVAVAESGTLIVIETDVTGKPLERYPPSLLLFLESTQLEKVGSYLPESSPGRIENLLSSLSGYNKNTGWVVYRKTSVADDS